LTVVNYCGCAISPWHEQVVAPAPEEAGCDQLVNGGVTDIGIEQTEAAQLPSCQTQSRHLLVFRANSFNRSICEFVNHKHGRRLFLSVSLMCAVA